MLQIQHAHGNLCYSLYIKNILICFEITSTLPIKMSFLECSWKNNFPKGKSWLIVDTITPSVVNIYYNYQGSWLVINTAIGDYAIIVLWLKPFNETSFSWIQMALQVLLFSFRTILYIILNIFIYCSDSTYSRKCWYLNY